MGNAFGIGLKLTGTKGLFFKAAAMRWNAGREVRNQHSVTKWDKRFKDDIAMNHVHQAGVDVKNVNKAAKLTTEKAHSLAMNDFILLHALIRTIQQIKDINLLLMRKAKFNNKALEKQKMNLVNEQNIKISQSLKIIMKNLTRGQRALFDIEKEASERHGFGAVLKNSTFMDNQFINYVKLRHEVGDVRKHLVKVQSAREDVAKIVNKIRKELKKGKTTMKQFEAQFNELAKKESELVMNVRKGALDVYKLFFNSYMILHIVVKTLSTEIREEKGLAEAEQIPHIMLLEDQKVKSQILKEVRDNARGEWKAVQQDFVAARA